jgi:aminopeptidase N
MFRRLLLASIGLVVVLPAGARGAKWTGRLGDTVVPSFQAIHLTVDPARPDYEGTVEIHVDVRDTVSSFRLHAEGITFGSVDLSGGGGDVPVTAGPLDGTDDAVELRTDRPLAPGPYVLRIAFTNPYDTTAVGLYRLDYRGDAYAYTQFESDDARRAFPCFDEPSFKIPFQVTLTTPLDDVAITNTPAESETVDGGMRTTVFARTKPLPTYLLAVAVGPFDLVDMPDFPFPARVVTPRGQRGLTDTVRQEALPILRALERYFDRPYPYAKLDLIAVPEFWPGAMEHPGAITFRDTVLLLDPSAVTPAERSVLVRDLAHELAHQWFGNLVTLAWWDDLWLNESFADWMGNKVADEVHPEERTQERALLGTQRVLQGDARPSSRAIRRPVHPGDSLMEGIGVTYSKGRLVLAMFEEWAGPGRFRDGVLDYLRENEWGNATADDLWRALDKATGRPVSVPMSGFLEQPGYPVIEIRRSGAHQVRISQRRFHAAGVTVPDEQWQVPIRLRYADDLRVKSATLLLDRPEKTFDLNVQDSLDWIYPNAGARGYYRWTLSSTYLAALTGAAESALEPRERIELVGDLGALVDSGDLHVDDYLKTLLDFAADPRATVTQSVLDGALRIRGSFPDPDLAAAFAVYLRALLTPVLDRIGPEPVPGEEDDVTGRRPRVLEALGTWGRDAAVRARARERTRAFLEDEKSVPPSVAGAWLSLAARDGDAALWDTFRARFEAATVPHERVRYLGLLGAFDDPALREKALEYALEARLRPQETLTIPRTEADLGESEHDRVVSWLLEHYDRVVPRIPPPNRPWLVGFGGGCSSVRWNRVREFFSQEEHQVPGTAPGLERVGDSVQECLALREREGDAVRTFLHAFAADHGGESDSSN